MAQEEYFSVSYALTLNVEPLADNETLPSVEQFEKEIPVPFRVASECGNIEHSLELDLAHLKREENKTLMNYLANQNTKLNLLLSFMLSQQDDNRFRYQSESFGASQFSFKSNSELNVGTLARVKLFLEHPPAAIYCYAEVTTCKPDNGQFLTELSYLHLNESDRDLLIRAALYQQQQLLKKRAHQRLED